MITTATLKSQCPLSSTKEGIIGAIGNTPLIKINSLSEQTGCTILAKAEFMNPSGSVKDRIANKLISDAEEKGLISNGGTIVEATTGNTGAALAHACRAKDYKCVIFVPETLSPEKIQLLVMLGAQVKRCKVVDFDNKESYYNQAKEYAATNPNHYFTNQMGNLINYETHYNSTGPEIYYQSKNQIDAFTCASGTGGTFAGCVKYFDQKDSNIRFFLTDPPGSSISTLINHGCKNDEPKSFVEGVGHNKISENLKQVQHLIEKVIRIEDEQSINMVYNMLHKEGLYLGGSSALNLSSAVKVAEIVGKGHTIVTILPDAAYRYQSRIFSKSFLESRNLLHTLPIYLHKYIVFD